MPSVQHTPSEKALTIASNLAFVVPWVVASIAGDVFLLILTPLIILSSTVFHIFKPYGPNTWNHDRKNDIQFLLLYVDTLFALVGVSYIIYLFWIHGLPAIFWFLLPLVTFSMYVFQFWRKRFYEETHTLWHITAAAVMTIALLL